MQQQSNDSSSSTYIASSPKTDPWSNQPRIVIPGDCLTNMISSSTSPISVQALPFGRPEVDLQHLGLNIATEFLFWKEENLALLEMSFPAIDRDVLEEVLVETDYNIGVAVDLIRSRVDVINDMDGGEISLEMNDMMHCTRNGDHQTAHEWVLVQDDWVVVEEKEGVVFPRVNIQVSATSQQHYYRY
jgi:hypothetical protein